MKSYHHSRLELIQEYELAPDWFFFRKRRLLLFGIVH